VPPQSHIYILVNTEHTVYIIIFQCRDQRNGIYYMQRLISFRLAPKAFSGHTRAAALCYGLCNQDDGDESLPRIHIFYIIELKLAPKCTTRRTVV